MLVIIQKVSIVARAVVASISIVAVMVTPTIVSFTLFNICNNRNLNYLYTYIYLYVSLDMILSANNGCKWPSLIFQVPNVTKYQQLVKISALALRTRDITITCVLVIMQKVSILARAVVASISIVAVMLTPTIVSLTLIKICNNRNLNIYIYRDIYRDIYICVSA